MSKVIVLWSTFLGLEHSCENIARGHRAKKLEGNPHGLIFRPNPNTHTWPRRVPWPLDLTGWPPTNRGHRRWRPPASWTPMQFIDDLLREMFGLVWVIFSRGLAVFANRKLGNVQTRRAYILDVYVTVIFQICQLIIEYLKRQQMYVDKRTDPGIRIPIDSLNSKYRFNRQLQICRHWNHTDCIITCLRFFFALFRKQIQLHSH